MNCPWCKKDASNTFNKIGWTKTCDTCGGKFRIGFKVKESAIYVCVGGGIAAVASLVLDNSNIPILIIVCSLPFVFRSIYKTIPVDQG